MLHRRGVVHGTLAVAGMAVLGCGARFRQHFTPGALDWDAKPFAFQFGATAETYASGCATTASRRLEASTPDALRLFEELRRTNQRLALSIEVSDYDLGLSTFDGTSSRAGKFTAEAVKMRASYESQGGKTPTPSKAAPAKVEVGGFTIVNAPVGIAQDVVERGQQAVFGIPYELNGINAMVALERKSAFELLVLKKRLELGQRADYRIADRPPEKSIADIDLGLALIAGADAALNRWRASLILLMAIYAGRADEAGLAVASTTSKELASDMREWLAAHPLLTSMEQVKARADAFGMTMRPLLLPTPANMLAVLDESGYVAAALKVAQGIATGSVADTMEGVGRFAPKDSSARAAMDGLAAAARGDLGGCADAVGRLAGKDPGVAKVRESIASLRR